MNWTNEQKRKAAKELCDLANCYELKVRKFIKVSSIRFQSDGQARYIGKAHDYTYNEV